ncbi:MAG TPA: hypothetical protein VFM08_06235 [Nocardioides sp.]|nr:hypothetical protein [Nocardioides sp.]
MRSSRSRRVLAAAALVGLVTLDGSSPAWAWTSRFGHVDAADRTLRPGCQHYRYHYVLKPASDDWLFETWLYDPRGKPRGSGDFAPGSDPARGHARFGICRSTVVPGRFTIKARLTWWTPGMLPLSPPVEHTRWFKPAHFRLHR